MLKKELNTRLIIFVSVLISLIKADTISKQNKNETGTIKDINDDIFYFSANYTGTNNSCLKARFSAAFEINYQVQQNSSLTTIINMSEPKRYNGSCMEHNNTLKIEFGDDWILEMIYSLDKSDYALTDVKLTYKVNADLFPNATNSGTYVAENKELMEFSVIIGKSYKCYSLTKIALNNNVTIELKNYQAQAFIDTGSANKEFDTAVECVADIVGSNKLVPIVIGIVLIILVALVLIAYVIGHRRYRPTYQQV